MGRHAAVLEDEQCLHEAHQATQEYNHHETVEDAEPVNAVLKEAMVQVSLEPIGKINFDALIIHIITNHY